MRPIACPAVAAVALLSLPAWALNNAAFVSQTVPTDVTPGAQFAVDVTMQNTGDTSWTQASGYFLGSQSPMDNMLWGTNRMALDQGASVAPGATTTFHATVTAPSQPGDYGFQWQVLQDAVEWFGAMSTNVVIHVAPQPPMTCDGTEKVCLSLTDLAAVQASGATIGGDINSDGFLPVDQGGLDWHFGPEVGLCAGKMEVDVQGLLPQTASGQPEQVSVFELCGEGAEAAQVLGLQRMMLNYHGNNIFRYYETTDFNAYGWQLGIWTDGFEATGWTSEQTHHFAASWASGDNGKASLGLTIDGQTWSAGGTTQFGPMNKIFTLGARCTHYPQQHAVARFKNFRLWVQGCPTKPDAGAPDAAPDAPADSSVVPEAGQGGSPGAGGSSAAGGNPIDAGKGGSGPPAHGVDPTVPADKGGCSCRATPASHHAVLMAPLVLLLAAMRRRIRA